MSCRSGFASVRTAYSRVGSVCSPWSSSISPAVSTALIRVKFPPMPLTSITPSSPFSAAIAAQI
eukprot:3465775-Pleurochrysis_carterae.AAC.1